MKESEYIDHLIALHPHVKLMLENHVFLPRISNIVAEHCFIDKIENEHTEVLRYQLKQLNEKGCFDFG
jgi:hypothetical protein